jgi:uncharacterized protein (TIGR02996 family)
MDEEPAFVAAIRASPTDNTARLVYADWLDENDHAGGEFLRAECELAALPHGQAQWQEAFARLQQASAGLPAWWCAAVSRWPIGHCGEVADRFADLNVRPRFWELIDAAQGEEGLRSILTSLSRADLIQFEQLFDDATADLVFRVIGPHGDAYTEEEIAAWVVSQGSICYARIWDHPEEFPTELPDERPTFYGLAGAVFEERFPGQPVTVEEPSQIAWWPEARGSIVLRAEA